MYIYIYICIYTGWVGSVGGIEMHKCAITNLSHLRMPIKYSLYSPYYILDTNI